jgi:hypothetical protein
MNIIRCAAVGFVASFIIAIAWANQDKYYPANAFGGDLKSNQEWIALYSKYLEGFREPSLFERAKSPSSQSYRFLWLRSFHKPILVRLDVGSDAIGRLTIKIGSGPGVSATGGPVDERIRRLTKQQTDSFLDQINTLGFWELSPQEDPVSGPDGARWIVEGVKDGQYHVVHRWTPQNGAVRTLGLDLATDLGRLKIPANEIY